MLFAREPNQPWKVLFVSSVAFRHFRKQTNNWRLGAGESSCPLPTLPACWALRRVQPACFRGRYQLCFSTASMAQGLIYVTSDLTAYILILTLIYRKTEIVYFLLNSLKQSPFKVEPDGCFPCRWVTFQLPPSGVLALRAAEHVQDNLPTQVELLGARSLLRGIGNPTVNDCFALFLLQISV